MSTAVTSPEDDVLNAPVRPGLKRRLRRRLLGPWLLLSPTLLVLALLLFWPLIRMVNLSFQKYGLRELNRNITNYNGLSNYTTILSDPYLWKTVIPNTVGFAAVSVITTVVFGTLVALFLNRLGPTWRAICSSAIMVAWAVPSVTGTYVWVWLFDPSTGLVSSILQGLGMLDPTQYNWFAHRLPFYGIVLLNIVHHGFPFVAVTVLAGLLSVPKELYEAATMDGASKWRQFWQVTVPMLRPVFAVVTILSTIWDFKVFSQIFLMPGGDGGNRDIFNLGVWSYIESFAQNKYGFGSAIAVLLTFALLLITIVYLRTLFKEDEDL